MVQNQPVLTGSAEVSRKVFDGGALHVMGVLVEAGDLVIRIGHVASRALLKEVEFSNDRVVVEPMAEGRR